MKEKLLDISNKIDAFTIELLKMLNEIAGSLQIEFFIVGATARDFIMHYAYGIEIFRATNDVDLGVSVKTWEGYQKLITELLNNGFSKTNAFHKLNYKGYPGIDIIPFGEISGETSIIKWPDKEAKVMNVMGFEEAFASTEIVKISNNPQVVIKFASAKGLALLKIFSWKHGYPARDRDAIDLLYIIQHYLECDNEDRLFNQHSELVDDQFDYETASARLLGRDVASITEERTLQYLIQVLENETGEQARYRLVEDMIKSDNLLINADKKYNHCLKLIEQFKLGVFDKR